MLFSRKHQIGNPRFCCVIFFKKILRKVPYQLTNQFQLRFVFKHDNWTYNYVIYWNCEWKFHQIKIELLLYKKCQSFQEAYVKVGSHSLATESLPNTKFFDRIDFFRVDGVVISHTWNYSWKERNPLEFYSNNDR